MGMAGLSLQQVEAQLATRFAGTGRRIVFWYDDDGAFADEIDALALPGVKVWHLTQSNQFRTKRRIELEDPASSYLIYAPFPKPPLAENHLEDMLLYAERFAADRVSLVLADLGLDDVWKPFVAEHFAFFANKVRVRQFDALEIDQPTETQLALGMMCVLARQRTASFAELLRALLADAAQARVALAEFDRYGVTAAFWAMCEAELGYVAADGAPTLAKLAVALFLTAAGRALGAAAPAAWRPLFTTKPGSVYAFLDGMRNHVMYQEAYDRLSDEVAARYDVCAALAALPREMLVGVEFFREVDALLIDWMRERLEGEDVHAQLGGHEVPELCAMRRATHFGAQSAAAYDFLTAAHFLIAHAHFVPAAGFESAMEQYVAEDWRMDAAYRHFQTAYDACRAPESFDVLAQLVEEIYTNGYLGRQVPAWNKALVERGHFHSLPQQIHFYRESVKPRRERTVVIISDALRYEVGAEFAKRLADRARYPRVKIDAMIATLPSRTRLGMAALLPHKEIMLADGRVLVDGKEANGLASRRAVLQQAQPASDCVRYDDIHAMNKTELRRIFARKQVVYVYHNAIDNAGEHTPEQVFSACEQAMREIEELIRRLTVSANTQHFLVTADHGFLYKRKKLDESGKISIASDAPDVEQRRAIVADTPVKGLGVRHLPLDAVLENGSAQVVSFPLGVEVFKVAGAGGLNYVHGGSSPQELLVPVLDVYSEKSHTETHPAQIMLVSLLQRVTNFVTSVQFMQTEPVTDTVKAAVYDIAFEDAQGALISNMQNYHADSRAEDAKERFAWLTFTLKNQYYNDATTYALVARNHETGEEVIRCAVEMDLP